MTEMSNENLADYLSTSQFARKVGYSESWVRKQVDNGRIPAISTPIGRLIPVTAAEKMIKERESAL